MFNSALKAFYTQTSGAPAREPGLSLHEAHHGTLPLLLRTGKGSAARRAPVGTSRPQQDFGQDHVQSVLKLTPVTVPRAGGEGEEVETQPGIAPIATAAPSMGMLPQTPRKHHVHFLPR